MLGKSVVTGGKKVQTAEKKIEKTFWFCDCFIYFKDGAFTAVKRGKQSSKLGM